VLWLCPHPAPPLSTTVQESIVFALDLSEAMDAPTSNFKKVPVCCACVLCLCAVIVCCDGVRVNATMPVLTVLWLCAGRAVTVCCVRVLCRCALTVPLLRPPGRGRADRAAKRAVGDHGLCAHQGKSVILFPPPSRLR